ncbi:Hypothetical protein A7982_07615 [Minicystis rosea]|nr:Hypothetical protein A7982_07615 [Minicystis rosea]
MHTRALHHAAALLSWTQTVGRRRHSPRQPESRRRSDHGWATVDPILRSPVRCRATCAEAKHRQVTAGVARAGERRCGGHHERREDLATHTIAPRGALSARARQA